MLPLVCLEIWLLSSPIIKVRDDICSRKHWQQRLLGWTPMHHAVYCDHVPILRLLHNKYPELLEQPTKDRFVKANLFGEKWSTLLHCSRQSTPLLLAATSGALDAVECLVSLNANVAYKDELGNTVIHLAASNVHTNVIEYFIHLNHRLVPTWRILVGRKSMNLFVLVNGCVWCIDLINHPDLSMKRATVQCLHVMTTHGEEFWQPLLETGQLRARQRSWSASWYCFSLE